MTKSSDFSYNVLEEVGILSEGSKGWAKELNIISWNGGKAKFDIRDWDETKEKMGKGITLTTEEVIRLRDMLNELEL